MQMLQKLIMKGLELLLYTDKPRFLMENNEIISTLVNQIKKRIVIRTDEKIRKSEEDARKILDSLVPDEAGLEATFFDTAIGEVSIEVKRPWLCQRNAQEFDHTEVTEQTGWRLRIKKSTTKPSNTIKSINYQLKISSADRAKQLKSVGEEIFRSRLVQKSEVSLLTLGGFGQVGRSCMLLTTPDSKVLIDCGINPGARTPSEAFPRLDWANISLDELDAIVIGHAHSGSHRILACINKIWLQRTNLLY